MTRIVGLLALVAIVGCGKKNEPASGGEAAASSGVKANVPGDANSQAFAKAILSTPVRSFRPVSAGEVEFTYVTMTFKEDNSWLALAKMGAGDETVDCKEAGTWIMEPAESATTAMMEWKVANTDCPGRPANNIMRTKVVVKDGKYEIYFR